MKLPKKIRYFKDKRKILAKLFNCKPSQVDDFSIGYYDPVSKETQEISAMDTANFQNVWGFTDINNTEILCYTTPIVTLEELIHFFAHELGHLNYKDLQKCRDEELKVEFNGLIAVQAYIYSQKALKHARA